MSEDAIKIFYSYSRKDLNMRNALEDHLSTLREAGKINTWHDLELEAGTEWELAILNKLDTADIILLLISSNFIASKYCYGTELKRAITRHHQGTARVIPIILRPCDWNHSDVPFSRLNVLPTHAQPITKWPDPEEAFAIVAQRIRETVDQLRAKKLAEQQVEEQQRQRLLGQKEAEQQTKQVSNSTKTGSDENSVITPLPKARPLSQVQASVSESTATERLNPNYQQQSLERSHEERLADYQHHYLQASRRKYPISDSDRHALKSLQQVLRLSENDVLIVEKRIETARRSMNRPNTSLAQSSVTQNTINSTTQTSSSGNQGGTNWAEAARRLKRDGISWAEEFARRLKGDMD